MSPVQFQTYREMGLRASRPTVTGERPKPVTNLVSTKDEEFESWLPIKDEIFETEDPKAMKDPEINASFDSGIGTGHSLQGR